MSIQYVWAYLTNTPSSNAAILFDDYCNSSGYNGDPSHEESVHHHSYEGASSHDTTYGDPVEPLLAPAFKCFQGVIVSQNPDDRPLYETEFLDKSGPPFQTVYPPAVQQPINPTEILRILERHAGGNATCLWIDEGRQCGYYSQIDLVKRHIKRVHFKLR